MAEKAVKRLPEKFPIPKDVEQALVATLGPRERKFYEKFCSASMKIFGSLVKGYKLSDSTARDLKEAGLKVSSEEWAAGMLSSIFLPLIPLLVLWLLLSLFGGDFFGLLYLPILGFLLGGLGLMLFQIYPSSRASSRKSEAQSKAINTIFLLSFSLYHRPDIRGATVYAADSSDGKLAEDMRKGLLELDEKRRYETVRHLLSIIANEWGKIDDSVRQAIYDLLRSTGTRDEASRAMDVSKAPTRVLEGAEEQLGKKLGGLVMPTLAFLTFGSLAIIATVGLSPVLSVIGMELVDIKFFVGMSAALCLAFLLFTLYMGGRRPATIQATELPRDAPGLPPPGKVKVAGRLFPSWVPPAAFFCIVAWPGFLYLCGIKEGLLGILAMSFSTLWIVWGVAVALVVHAYLYSSERKKLREMERKKVVDWTNALNTIGSRMLDGKPVARAMEEAAELMKGSPIEEELRSASRKMEATGCSLADAIFGKKRHYSNPLIKSFIEIISRIRADSEAVAGRACMMAAEFLGTLQRVERRFRERIDEAMGNLWLVAVVLIPVVCAMAVWVMDFMSGMRFRMLSQAAQAGVSGLPFLIGALEATELALLRLVMGITAIVLSIIIARYIAHIRAPGDRVEFWLSVMKSSIATAVVFTGTTFLLATIGVG
ncbi:MAG: hypothetical protein QW179_00750 [Candidatus Hadarchaeales archaeon]